MNLPENTKIVLFDGQCNLCSATVQFLLKRDKKKCFRFVSQQSSLGEKLLAQFSLQDKKLETVVLIDDNKAYTHSTAVCKMMKELSFPWPCGYAAMVIPRFVRNFFYDFITSRRYRWFGKREQCYLPKPEWKDRFLE